MRRNNNFWQPNRHCTNQRPSHTPPPAQHEEMKNSTPIPPPSHEPDNTHDEDTFNKKISEFLSKFTNHKLDADTLIIIAIMYFLIREGADIKLVLALAYTIL